MNIFWWCWGAGLLFCLVMGLYCNYQATKPISDSQK